MEMRPIMRGDTERRLGEAAFLSLAALFVFLAYWIVFSIARTGTVVDHIVASLRNLISLAVSVAAVLPLLKRLLRRPAEVQIPAHAALALAFSLLWYWLLMVLIGLVHGQSPFRFSVQPFAQGPAVAWQLLQGVTAYASIAALTALRARPPLPTFLIAGAEPAAPARPALSRYFIREGEDIRPIDIDQIVSIVGADDYAEVSTLTERHLVRMTLTEFEQALAGESFIRIHRSRIVNLDRIARAEPAGGGRMLLHMETGEIIKTSRAGSRLLRDRLI